MTAEDLSGKSLGAFQLRERLWSDQYGTIYRAQQTDVEREVALKVTLVDIRADPTLLERFRSEAKILAALEHPNIATVYTYGVENGRGYIATRLLTGGTLAEHIKTSSPLVSEIITQIQGVADALDFAHTQGVIHRAVNPDNLIYDKWSKLYLTNFSVARILGSSITNNTVLMGAITAPPFWAPEGWVAEKLNGQMDQFSLAAVLYFCLTKRAPFVDVKPDKLVNLYVNRGVIPPEVLLNIDPALQPTFERAFARQPENRFPDVITMAREFQNAIKAAGNLAAPVISTPAVNTPAASAPPPVDEDMKTSLNPSVPEVSPAPPVDPATEKPTAPAIKHITPPPTVGPKTELEVPPPIQTAPVQPPVVAAKPLPNDKTELDVSQINRIYPASPPIVTPTSKTELEDQPSGQSAAPSAPVIAPPGQPHEASDSTDDIPGQHSRVRRWRGIVAVVDMLLVILLVVLLIVPRPSQSSGIANLTDTTVPFTATDVPSATTVPVIAPSDVPSATAAPTATTPPTDVPSATPPQIVLNLNVSPHTGPGSKYPTTEALTKGTQLDVLGISADRQWYLVALSSGDQGWVATQKIIASPLSDVSSLPVMTAAPLPSDTPSSP